ncbi:MAG: transcription antitermination factor NusB [Bacilli bacterium]|jgi:N utilization substance protein B
MTKSRREQRQTAMIILYQIFLFKKSKNMEEIMGYINNHLKIETDFVQSLVNGVLSNYDKIINLSNKYLKEWKLERLNKVDQAILGLGVYELLYTSTPDLVCIDEAIELSKLYSDEAVSKMINGVLDKIYHNEK